MAPTPVRHTLMTIALFLAAASLALAGDKGEDVEELLRQYHVLGQFNGTALVVGGGETLLRKGFGIANRDWQIDNAPDSRYLVGSITKSFTALAVLQLAEAGRLDLDAAITDYLPYYRDDTGSRITIRNLLTHTDGVPSYTGDSHFWSSYENGVPYSTPDFIARYCSGDLMFEPGGQYRYGNSGFSILGAIIESVTGTSYGNVVAAQIFNPIGMSDTGQYQPNILLPRRALGYEVSIDGYRPASPIYKSLRAAGSMYSTVDDLARFSRALSGSDAVSAANAAVLFASREGAVEGTFAYGWSVGALNFDTAGSSLRYMASNGEINGFNALLLRLPDADDLVVLLNNSGETDLFGIAANILRLLNDIPIENPEPRLRDAFIARLRDDSLDSAVSFYREQRETRPDDYLFFPWPMRILAGQLLEDGRADEAIVLLNLNLETNLQDVRSMLMLAQAQIQSGDKSSALVTLRAVLEVDRRHDLAGQLLRQITN